MGILPVLGGECSQVACVPADPLGTDLQYANAGMSGSWWNILPRIMLYELGSECVCLNMYVCVCSSVSKVLEERERWEYAVVLIHCHRGMCSD